MSVLNATGWFNTKFCLTNVTQLHWQHTHTRNLSLSSIYRWCWDCLTAYEWLGENPKKTLWRKGIGVNGCCYAIQDPHKPQHWHRENMFYSTPSKVIGIWILSVYKKKFRRTVPENWVLMYCTSPVGDWLHMLGTGTLLKCRVKVSCNLDLALSSGWQGPSKRRLR